MRTRDITTTAVISRLNSNRRFKRCQRRGPLIQKINKMKRVSSRQRLVSWDAFDASPKASSRSGIMSYYETPPSPWGIVISDSDDSSQETIGARTRKRNRVERALLKKSAFQKLCSDVHLHITSFLDVPDARSLMLCDKEIYSLISNASFLWKSWCHQLWSHLPHDVQFVDERSTSACAVPNYSQLLRLATTKPPTQIDTSTFTFRRRANPVFRQLDTPNKIQYLGAVGMGDRCIRANAPLPKPVDKTKKTNIFKFLLSRHHRPPKPFVSPFVGNHNKIVLTPRHASYFEVSILSDGPDVGHEQTPGLNVAVADCVAIGLSTEGFRCFSRMPGWDAYSYGYHGDDGGIFHASGDMLKRFGPPFGKGDTVGCGVDYLNGGVFFTLNGKMLGYGWTGLDLNQKDLYPTIGVDSNAPVDCNFGERPFTFDLSLFLKNQRELSTGRFYRR